MVQGVAVGAEFGILDLVNEHVWNELKEVEVVETVLVLGIDVIVNHSHHVKVGVVICTKAKEDVDVLRDLSKGERRDDVRQLEQFAFFWISSL
jgi:hypothetical protein